MTTIDDREAFTKGVLGIQLVPHQSEKPGAGVPRKVRRAREDLWAEIFSEEGN